MFFQQCTPPQPLAGNSCNKFGKKKSASGVGESAAFNGELSVVWKGGSIGGFTAGTKPKQPFRNDFPANLPETNLDTIRRYTFYN